MGTEKLAALTPRPRINLILYHGVLAPHARWRSRIVPGPDVPRLDAGASLEDTRGVSRDDTTGRPQPPRHWRWADLMRRAFDVLELDALANKDFQYLTKQYLPRKLKEKGRLD